MIRYLNLLKGKMMTDDDDDFQLQDPIRVDQTDDGATYSNDKKLKAIGILGE